jgi:hypothetical protein
MTKAEINNLVRRVKRQIYKTVHCFSNLERQRAADQCFAFVEGVAYVYKDDPEVTKALWRMWDKFRKDFSL